MQPQSNCKMHCKQAQTTRQRSNNNRVLQLLQQSKKLLSASATNSQHCNHATTNMRPQSNCKNALQASANNAAAQQNNSFHNLHQRNYCEANFTILKINPFNKSNHKRKQPVFRQQSIKIVATSPWRARTTNII